MQEVNLPSLLSKYIKNVKSEGAPEKFYSLFDTLVYSIHQKKKTKTKTLTLATGKKTLVSKSILDLSKDAHFS